MATHHGNEGSVYNGASAIAEVTAWSYDEDVELAEDSAMGDVSKSYLAGMNDGNGTVTCWWDETDTNGQEALTIGATVTLNLYPEGNVTDDQYKTGSVIIKSIAMAGDKGSIISRTFTFQGKLADATV